MMMMMMMMVMMIIIMKLVILVVVNDNAPTQGPEGAASPRAQRALESLVGLWARLASDVAGPPSGLANGVPSTVLKSEE